MEGGYSIKFNYIILCYNYIYEKEVDFVPNSNKKLMKDLIYV